MSRIYESIKNAYESRATVQLDISELLSEFEAPTRHAHEAQEPAQKKAEIELTVYGRSSYGGPFYERAKPLSGDANGGAFLLPVPVVEGQSLLLINNRTSAEQICMIESAVTQDTVSMEVRVRFSSANATFWNAAAEADAAQG